MRIWVDFFNTRVHPTGSDLQKIAIRKKPGRRWRSTWRTLDKELTGKDFLVGDQFSLADITFIPFYTRRERYNVTV